MVSEYGPEFDDYVKRVREELVPKIKETQAFISITPSSPEEVDVKFAVELGLAIMFDKPIIAAINPGSTPSEKLARVVDEFVEVDFKNPGSAKQRLNEAITRVMGIEDEEKDT